MYVGIEYVHSTNKGCARPWRFNETMEGNTGFYAVRSSPSSVAVWDYTYRACSQAPLYDDQTINWLILRHIQSPLAYPLDSCPSITTSGSSRLGPASVYGPAGSRNADLSNTAIRDQFIVSCPLNDCKYSASQLRDYSGVMKLQDMLSRANEKAVMIHANWMNGHGKKKDALMNVGLWITRRVSTDEDEENNRGSNWTCVAKINSAFV